MSQLKYLPFTNISDLKRKIEILTAAKEENMQTNEEWLQINGIPYQKLADDSIMLDIGKVPCETLDEFQEICKKTIQHTEEVFKELGVLSLATGSAIELFDGPDAALSKTALELTAQQRKQ